MKILIFASPRSGSTALTVALSRLLKLRKFLEPYNIRITQNMSAKEISNIKSKLTESCIVKVLAKQMTREFYSEYINFFDKVIYLTREDTKASAESVYSAVYRKDTHLGGPKWHTPYTFNYSDVTIDKWIVEYINTNVSEVKLVAKSNKKSYILYEELYSQDVALFNKTVDSFDFHIDKVKLRELLHPSKKYRKKVKPKTIS